MSTQIIRSGLAPVFAPSNSTVSGVDIARGGYLIAAPGAILSGNTGAVV